MDYPEPDYEQTAREKMIEVLECVVKNGCVIRQDFRRGEADKPNFQSPSDLILIWREDGTSVCDVEPQVMKRLVDCGLMSSTIEDYPGNEHFRRFVYHPVEPAASKFLETQALAGAQ
jgi:hypothetical protein